MNYTIRNLKKAEQILTGMTVPKEYYGNVGKLVEDVMENAGYPINRGLGPDLIVLGVEIKTRKIEASAAHTIGKMKKDDIIAMPWESSRVFQKFQQQFRVYYSDTDNVIVSAKMYDFRNEETQKIIKHSYESARVKIASGIDSRYIRGDDAWGYFENTISRYPDLMDFRFPDNHMKELEALSVSTFHDLFEYA